jgi:surfeit locus 1 family protein
MIRKAVQPKWLGALLLAVAFAAVCGYLGAWQLEEARAEGRAQALERAAAMPVAPITDVVGPQSTFPRDGSTRPVLARGTYATQHQFLVTDRRLDGATGYWVLTPLVVSDTGAWLPVLRGFVTEPGAAPDPPAGEIEVTGGLAPSESPRSEAGLPDGVLRSVDLSLLVNRWDAQVYNAFVFATGETAMAGDDVERALPAEGLTRVPPPTGEQVELNLKNAMYAVQWWVFAAFGLFLWWRAVRQAHQEAGSPEPIDSDLGDAGEAGSGPLDAPAAPPHTLDQPTPTARTR